MLRYIPRDALGHQNQYWLDSFYHFSFGGYHNPQRIQFGVLRVLNDDRVGVGTGMGLHDHENMEILSYIVEGELTHVDNKGNRDTIKRGQVQYISAGSGIEHGEYNYGHEVVRMLQIWILPNQHGLEPSYHTSQLKWEDRVGDWLPIASGDGNSAFSIQLKSDVHIYATLIPKGEKLTFSIPKGRQAYLVNIEGVTDVNGQILDERDALEAVEEDLQLESLITSHLLIIEMKVDEVAKTI